MVGFSPGLHQLISDFPLEEIIVAHLAGGGAALRNVRIVFGAPVVAELVGRDQVRFAGDDALSVVVAARAQARVQVERVAILGKNKNKTCSHCQFLKIK